MPPETPVNLARFLVARERYWRRCQLWANARRRLGDEAFFANIGAVERSIAQQLETEFGA
ncbi:hypothetical protein [uncultured Roseovarius sp.]|uniref:hypothetical protein n=1 Tax=uncultured Roseovarius sp. TaxID=293344 RepID=UPI002591EBB5|nr:hypothetical protein [uncultured Roseovarius sp.]